VLQLNRRVPPKRDDERDWPAVSQEVVSRWPPALPTTAHRPRHGQAKHAETCRHPTSPNQQQQPVMRGKTSPVRFHFALRFTTVALARTSDSLEFTSSHGADPDGGHDRNHAWRLSLGSAYSETPLPRYGRQQMNFTGKQPASPRERDDASQWHPSSRRQPYRRRPISRPGNAPTRQPSADHHQTTEIIS
jgi:hypothetical protein